MDTRSNVGHGSEEATDEATGRTSKPLTVTQRMTLLGRVMDILGYSLIACENVESGFDEVKSLLKWAGGFVFASVRNKWPISTSPYIDECTSLEQSFTSALWWRLDSKRSTSKELDSIRKSTIRKG